MTREQEKAIKVLEQYKNECIEEYKVELDDKKNIDEQHASYLHQQIEAVYIILNLIQEQEKFLLYDKNKLERFKKLLILKEKMIYIITKKLKETALITEACGYKISDDIDYRVSIELIIKEFERKVEGESNDKSTYGK